METVYIETSILSYLTAKASRDLIVVAHQELTKEWWETRNRFELFISEVVLNEISLGDSARVGWVEARNPACSK